MGDNFHELRLSLARRPASLFADADAIVPTREAYIREVFSRRWEFPHYGNIFHYVPHEPVAGQVALLGAIGRAFLSDENLAPEEGLEATIHKGWKASVLVVDPRDHEDGQKVMMNYDARVGKPLPLLSGLVLEINRERWDAPYLIAVDPIFEASSFYAFAEANKGDITSLTFDFSTPNMFGGADNLSEYLRNKRRQEGADSVSMKFRSSDGLNTDTDDVREGVDYATKGAGRVKARTKKGKKFDSKSRVKTVSLDRPAEPESLLRRVVREIAKLVPR